MKRMYRQQTESLLEQIAAQAKWNVSETVGVSLLWNK
jgi:hypothetical protein